jgi:hypothetical protein
MKRKWLLFSIGGLLTIGFGLSLLGEAIQYKMVQDSLWIGLGTLALIVTNTGICLVAEATVLKMKRQQEK